MDLQNETFVELRTLYHHFRETSEDFEAYRRSKKIVYNHVEHDDFKYIGILGKGGFGQVSERCGRGWCSSSLERGRGARAARSAGGRVVRRAYSLSSLALTAPVVSALRCAAQVVHVVKKSTGAHYAMKVQAKDTLVET
jgi:hypothetical protein